MKVEVTQTDKFTRSLAVEVPAPDVDTVRRDVIREIRTKTVLPGFRKGKVPEAIIERQFADTIRERTLERVLEPAARQALEQHVEEPALLPRVEELHYEPGEPLSFRMTVEVRPAVPVTGYKGLTMVREVYEVEDDDVDRAIEDLRHRVADLAPAYRRAQEGDIVLADLAEVATGAEPVEGEIRRGAQVKLTPELLAEPLGQALAGVIRGDERRVPLPDAPGREIWVRVADVTEEVLPPADDKFFQAIGLGDSADVGRARIRQILREEEDRRSTRQMAAQIVDELLARNPIELSPSQREIVRRVVEDETRRAAEEGRAPAEPAALEERAARELQRDVLLESIAGQENLSVSAEELDQEVRRLAERARLAASELRRRLEADDRLASLEREMLHGKVLAFLVEQASVRVDTKRREGRSRIILPGGTPSSRGGVIVPGR